MLNRIRLVAIATLFFASPALAQTVLDGKGALAEYDAGMAAIEAEEFETARVHLDRACQWGVAVACHNLGILWTNGKGGPKDMSKARPLFQTGCDGKYAGETPGDACFNYALALEKGWGGAQDLSGARNYYLKGCSTDQQYACFNAGNMQMQGIGGDVDDAGAFASYDKACGLDIGDACYNAAFLIVKKRATGTAEKGFTHYKTRACELGVEKVC
ncbi:MAG: tetratricopeptide repeat protein [Hyphomonas sp.]